MKGSAQGPKKKEGTLERILIKSYKVEENESSMRKGKEICGVGWPKSRAWEHWGLCKKRRVTGGRG